MLDIYLATPYTHKDKLIRKIRYLNVTKKAAILSMSGYIVFSPITHSHPMTELHDISNTWEFWSNIDKQYIKSCKCVVVYTQDGWKESIGVQNEIKWAKEELNKPVIYWDGSDQNLIDDVSPLLYKYVNLIKE